MGVALGFNYFIVLGCVIIAAIFYIGISRSNAGLMVSVLFGPIFVWILGYSYQEIITFMIIVVVVIFAHRSNIESFLKSTLKF